MLLLFKEKLPMVANVVVQLSMTKTGSLSDLKEVNKWLEELPMVAHGWPWSPPPQHQGLHTGERVQEGCCIVSLRESLTLRLDNQPSSLQARPRFSQTLRQVSSDCKLHLATPAFFTLRGYFSLDRQLTYKDCICRVLFGSQFLWTFTRFVSSIRIPFVRHTAAHPGQEALCKALKKKLAPFSVDNCKCLMVFNMLMVWKNASLHISPACDAIFALCGNQANNNLTTDSSVTKTCGQLEKPRWWFFWRQRVILDWLQHFNGEWESVDKIHFGSLMENS